MCIKANIASRQATRTHLHETAAWIGWHFNESACSRVGMRMNVS
jgi:hypothetical protein